MTNRILKLDTKVKDIVSLLSPLGAAKEALDLLTKFGYSKCMQAGWAKENGLKSYAIKYAVSKAHKILEQQIQKQSKESELSKIKTASLEGHRYEEENDNHDVILTGDVEIAS